MTPAARIIDANANRAREALRVLEDIARFALNDGALSADLKNLRHDLRRALETLPVDRSQRLAWRDTPDDVGTEITNPGEGARAGLSDVAAAGGARLSEALRSIEETSKTLRWVGDGTETPSRIEQLRYRAYELERRVLSAVGPRRCPQWRLCVLITEGLCRARTREEIAAQAIAGGAECIQLREKGMPDGKMLAAARSIRDITARAGVSFVVNDRPDVALVVGANGVHVGQGDLPVREIRKLAGRNLLVGVSTSTVEQARAAVAEGADYCGVGPMYLTATKDKPVLAGPEYLREYLEDPACRCTPHLAIGGISASNIGRLVEAGVRGVAVSAAVCGAPDPESACREILAELDPATARPVTRRLRTLDACPSPSSSTVFPMA